MRPRLTILTILAAGTFLVACGSPAEPRLEASARDSGPATTADRPPEDLNAWALEFLREQGVSVSVDGHPFRAHVIASKMTGIAQSRQSPDGGDPIDLEAEGERIASQAIALAVLNHLLISDAEETGQGVSLAEAEAYEAEARRNNARPKGSELSAEAGRIYLTLDKAKAAVEATNPADGRQALVAWFTAQLPRRSIEVRGLTVTAADLPGLLPERF